MRPPNPPFYSFFPPSHPLILVSPDPAPTCPPVDMVSCVVYLALATRFSSGQKSGASDPKSGRGMVGNAPNTLFFKYQCADSSAIGILFKWRFWFSGSELVLVILHFWWAFLWCQGSWSANRILSSNTWRFPSKGKILKEGPTSNSNCGDIHFLFKLGLPYVNTLATETFLRIA